MSDNIPGFAGSNPTATLSLKRLIIASCLLGLPAAHAVEPPACRNVLDVQLPDDASSPTPPDDAILLEAGAFEAQIGDALKAAMRDGVLLRTGNKLAGADNATYDPERRALLLEGDVRYEDPGTQIASDTAEFAYDTGRIRFSGAEFTLGSNNARGAADDLRITQDGRIELDGVRYTSCPPGSNDWLLKAADINIDTQSGIGKARDVTLRFQGLPILYAPFLSFPVSDARKTGLLTPEVGTAGRSGNEIRVPFYWNIAPNYDATITPRLLTDRGVQLRTEFRYLTDIHSGSLGAEYLSDDEFSNGTRHLVNVGHETRFDNGWRGRIDARDVSDGQYFEDLGGSLSVSSTTHLNRSLRFDYHTDTWSFIGQIQDYQTIDDAIVPADEPYRRLPQLLLRGAWPERWLGTRLSLDGELVNFDRDIGVTGWRLNLAPEVEWPVERPGWFITPAVALDHTRYELSNTLPGNKTDPTRTLPIASLDTGLVLERTINGAGTSRLQTIEPRLLYVHVPFREQSDLPVFDTIAPDLNLVQLFRKNRYLGTDRVADTDQLSLGITSRILDVSTGRELVTATIGQTRYLSESGVSLPDSPLSNDETSDYIAEIRFLLYENLNFDFGHQWGTGDNGTTQSEARLQYRPASNRILNLAYRFRRDSIEQGDLSWSWPLGTQWNFVGRYNFSFRDREVLEQFFGIEYESCCWGLRLVSRRHISTRDGTRDSSFGLQLVLKGMTSIGTSAEKLLERGILGYSADLR